MVATDAAGEDLAISSGDGSGELFADSSSPEEVVLPASDQATTIQLAERCFEGDVCPMTESFGVGVQIFGAELTLEDPTPPVVAVTGVQDEGGAGFDGPVQVAFTGSDPESGVKRAELLVDGAAVATDNYSSSCSYTRLQPCPGSVSDHLKSPPISFLNGAHELAVRVTDGAENTTVVPVPRIANGVPCPTPEIAIRADGDKARATVPFGRGAVVEGRLGCRSTPISGASVSLSTEVIGDGPAVATATLQTGPDGSFRYALPAGPGRKLNFSYRAYSDEPTSAVGASIQVDVRPRIRFHIFPARVHYDGTIYWRAAVEGGPYPVYGMELRLQYKVGKHWHTFADVPIQEGLLAYRYKLERTHTPTTYGFRVALPRTGAVGYPYTSAESREVRVHVGPGGKRSGASRGGKRRRSASRAARFSGGSSVAGVLCGGVSARVWSAGCG
jgi:hypothetical protein